MKNKAGGGLRGTKEVPIKEQIKNVINIKIDTEKKKKPRRSRKRVTKKVQPIKQVGTQGGFMGGQVIYSGPSSDYTSKALDSLKKELKDVVEWQKKSMLEGPQKLFLELEPLERHAREMELAERYHRARAGAEMAKQEEMRARIYEMPQETITTYRKQEEEAVEELQPSTITEKTKSVSFDTVSTSAIDPFTESLGGSVMLGNNNIGQQISFSSIKDATPLIAEVEKEEETSTETQAIPEIGTIKKLKRGRPPGSKTKTEEEKAALAELERLKKEAAKKEREQQRSKTPAAIRRVTSQTEDPILKPFSK